MSTEDATSASPNDALIKADSLCKFYGPFAAVTDVSFEVPRCQV